MASQARKRQPRWRRPPAPPQTVIQVRGRGARHVSQALRAQAQAEAVLKPPALFRYRYQLIPFAWGAGVVFAALILHVTHLTAAAAVAGILGGTALVLLTRHLSAFARAAGLAMAAGTALAVPLIAAFGPRPWLPLLGLGWAVLAACYARHYRNRPQAAPAEPNRDEEVWERLAAKRRWSGTLGDPERIPGGRRYPIRLDGVETHIGEVMAHPLSIAAAWHKPITEAYAEPAPDGIASRGYLTLLSRGTLEHGREWTGAGVTEDGFAVIGRYADGQDARIRLFAPMDGTRHGIVAGTSGSGKSELLSLMVHIMLSSGYILPVILDPQEGQSLPDWNGRVPYAAGVSECMEMLTLIHEGMLSRSRRLSRMTWDDEGHTRRMNFFDHALTGWPVVAVIADEHPMLLTSPGHGREAIRLTGEIGKLGRKTGVAIWPAAQVPSLSELGDQVVRAMLVGGNVVCLRTGEKVSQGMLGLPSDPSELPRFFGSGEYTYGLGYVLGPDNRQAIARTDIPSREARRRTYPLPELEPAFADILGRFGTALPLMPVSPSLAPVPVDDSPAPGGQTAADAILAVLTCEMDRGALLKAVERQAQDWGRKPWVMRGVTGPLAKLVDDGKVVKVREGVYGPARASLHLISGQVSQSQQNAGNTAAGGTA